MRTSKAVRCADLLLAGLLAGNELGTWAAVHPAVKELAPAGAAAAEQALTRRFGAVMPFWKAKGRIQRLSIEELEVGRLRVRELIVDREQGAPESGEV